MSQLKVNALVSYSGNTVTLGTSGDTINVASGVTFNTASATVTLPSTINATTINVTTVVLAAGAVGTPSLTTSGDTNTGIFFSTTDTIDFAEGGVATGQFDSSGNFKFNSGYGSVATAYGCRAWVNFNGQGTPSIRGSGNVTSITDNGTGNYTVNFTTAMTDINYCALSSGSITDDTGATSSSSPVTANNLSTSTVRIRTAGSSNTLFDFLNVFVAIFR
jgi:hypothetical protein